MSLGRLLGLLRGVLLGAALSLVFSASGLEGTAGADGAPLKDTLIPVTTPRGEKILVEVADTPQKRAKGLMFRKNLPKDRGMLFTFPAPQMWTIWMKNTLIPLDIIWLDSNKKIVHVERNVPGCRRTGTECPQYQPNDDASYVIEIAGGRAASLKLGKGMTLQFPYPEARPVR